MATASWGVTRKGELTIFNRDPPSCFSNRVARVRRSNSLEDRRLQDKLRTIHLEHTIRNGQIYKERKKLVNQLTGIQKVRETPEVGLERRKLQQAKAGNQVLFHKTGTRAHSPVPSSPQGHLSSHVTQNITSSAVTQYPSVDCRCCYTGYRLRRSSPAATSPDWKAPRSPTFPFPSVKESREHLGHVSIDEEYTYGIPNSLGQSGLNSCHLPTIDNKTVKQTGAKF